MIGNCIKINQLSKRYRGESIDSLSTVSLDIKSGDKYAILGPNGAGKTTLISILCGIIEQSSGGVTYWENATEIEFSKIQQKLGYVPQEYAFYHELTPVQNLEYFGAMYNLSSATISKRTTGIRNRGI